MSSQKQIEANRLNSQKSTGPRTAAGKTAIRFNALKSGVDAQSEVLPTENPAALDALVSEYYARWNPRSPEVRALVDLCIRNEWMHARLSRAERKMFLKDAERFVIDTTPTKEGRFWMYNTKELERLQRRLNAVQRNLQSAIKDLARAKAAERAEEAAQEAEEPESPAETAAESAPPPRIEPQSTQSPDSEIGSVPSLAENAPSAIPPQPEIGPNAGSGDALIA